ncbi:hypothetical protein BU26DRAFT_504048 [Trematosphaeria pertusa]|uniref:Uncharacterized protein n=1 Tax=Trematosphaeria pertusa TaxID=390896 RepID=A0A6A6INZ8_9PLEO|nr:uncharacterized protein BU26DRAFT_504048 [Trematosphaeria pertusa]KAF2251552.1 hypothetical protein BU26DRAFT_504048 [Trematosphaeria pertusa]
MGGRCAAWRFLLLGARCTLHSTVPYQQRPPGRTSQAVSGDCESNVEIGARSRGGRRVERVRRKAEKKSERDGTKGEAGGAVWLQLLLGTGGRDFLKPLGSRFRKCAKQQSRRRSVARRLGAMEPCAGGVRRRKRLAGCSYLHILDAFQRLRAGLAEMATRLPVRDATVCVVDPSDPQKHGDSETRAITSYCTLRSSASPRTLHSRQPDAPLLLASQGAGSSRAPGLQGRAVRAAAEEVRQAETKRARRNF